MRKCILKKQANDAKITEKNKKASKTYLVILVVLFILFSGLSLRSIKQPLQYQEKTAVNSITQKTSITYSTEALPDGMNSVNGTIFSKVQKNLKLHVNSIVTAEKPIIIKGTGIVYCDLIADGFWIQTMPISSNIKIDLNGRENTIINSDFQINLVDIKNKIEMAEDQVTGTSAEKYLLKIRPDIQADVTFEDKEIQLDSTCQLSFEYSNGLIIQSGDNKELVKNTPMEEITINSSKLTLLGIAIPILICRYVFSIAALVLLIVLIHNLRFVKSNYNADEQSPGYIDKKYRSRLVSLQAEPNLENRILLSVSNFKELVRVADDKELNILRYIKVDSRIVIYLVIDGECIYNYAADSMEGTSSEGLREFTLGSDMLNG